MLKSADSLAKMVQKDFWKNIQKLDRYQQFQAQQETHMKTQQKRLESFVNKQLKLSSKMADFLQESNVEEKSATEKEEEMAVESEAEMSEGGLESIISNDFLLMLSIGQIIIHLNKDADGYIYEKYTSEVVTIEGI